MALVGGLAGACSLGSMGTLSFREWTLDYNQATIDVTVFGTTTGRARVPGITQWSGSAEGKLDGTTAPILPTAAQSVTLTVATGRTWTGSAIITGLSPSVAVDGEVTARVSFDGTGELKIN